MGSIVVSENMTIDGVSQNPRWFDRLSGSDRAAWAKVEFAEALAAEALLMGRVTYEWFLDRGWATRTGEWADRLRSLPKYVVSSTLDRTEWSNTSVLTSDDVPGLKDRVAGEIVVYGSGRLVHALLEDDVVDELRLMICPFLPGDGERLFGKTSELKQLRLVDTRRVGDALVLLTYHPIRSSSVHSG